MRLGVSSERRETPVLHRVEVPGSTIVGIETPAEGRFAVWVRRGFLVLLLAFVLAGVTGLLGVRTATETKTDGGYALSLRYAPSRAPASTCRGR
jgi:hypothetical protein